jgi:2-oxoglutarate dehydrogenase E2 component (dihydrolipoamide succinyltransferase)
VAATAVDVVMPQMGVSVSEGTITKWLKSEGEHVEADEPLLEISTDKVDTDVPSPATGTLSQILVQEGETVDVGTKLAEIGGSGGGSAPAEAADEVTQPPEPATQAAADESMAAASEGVGDVAPEPAPAAPPAPAPGPERVSEPSGENGRTFVSPVVARIASEHGIDPEQVPGTGRGGRVTKKDILGFIEQGPQAAPAAPSPPPETPPAVAPTAPPPEREAPQPAAAASGELAVGESAEPVTAMRRGIAEHMRRSIDTAAHVTSAIEVDLSKVVGVREGLKNEYRQSYGVSLTYLAFIARATVETLRSWPWLNGELRGDKIITKKFVNLGFAVALEGGQGLIVPVIKNAQDLNLLGLARAVGDIAERARTKKLTPDDVQGGTFTITNPGGYGTFHGTPIINQPQVGILGTYALVKRPWVVQDDLGQDVIAIRPIMNLTLTYDHRLIDGAYGAQFLRDLQEKLESWEQESY